MLRQNGSWTAIYLNRQERQNLTDQNFNLVYKLVAATVDSNFVITKQAALFFQENRKYTQLAQRPVGRRSDPGMAADDYRFILTSRNPVRKR